MASVEIEKTQKSIMTLANASELSAQIIIHIAGNDISDSLSGSVVTLNMLRNIAQARFQSNLKLNG
jgi:hypothetical protein